MSSHTTVLYSSILLSTFQAILEQTWPTFVVKLPMVLSGNLLRVYNILQQTRYMYWHMHTWICFNSIVRGRVLRSIYVHSISESFSELVYIWLVALLYWQVHVCVYLASVIVVFWCHSRCLHLTSFPDSDMYSDLHWLVHGLSDLLRLCGVRSQWVIQYIGPNL